MSIENAITCIDIGSSKIRTVIGEFVGENNDKPQILGVGISDSNAMRKGNILDMDEFKANIDKSLEEAEKKAGMQTGGAFISFNSSSIGVIKNRGVIAIGGNEITEKDVNKVLEMTKNGINIPNKEVLKVSQIGYKVDNEEGIRVPIGMSAKKLEVEANIFTLSTSMMTNIKRAIEDIGVDVYDIFPNLISAPNGVLNKRQKELGVICIDIGASTTGITVYEGGALIHSAIIPIGGDNVTNDIALCLKISIEAGEKLKLGFAELSLEKIEDYEDTNIDLSKILKGETGEISKLFLSQVVTARYNEILYFIKDELKKIKLDGMLPEGAVLVGEGSKMTGLIDLTKDVLSLPAEIGVPSIGEYITDTSVDDPGFAGVIGTLFVTNRYRHARNVLSFNFGSIFGSIKRVFKKILP